jgi:small subunit ribosomal protein S1
MNDAKEQSFAELFESAGMQVAPEIKVGDRIKGRILAVGKDAVYVDTGTKVDGVVEKAELLDAQGVFPHKEGDELELYVVSRQSNEIRLSRAMGADGGAEHLIAAQENALPVEGKVKETCKGGFRVRVMNVTAFCPMSQMDLRPVDDPESYVGQSLHFLITRVEGKGPNVVVSRRKLLEQEQARSIENFLAEFKEGQIVEGKVTRVVPFGAFVEVAPSVEGLVHVSELGWSRTLTPEETFSVGDTVSVKVLRVQTEGKGRLRIDLSVKQTENDPWQTIASTFHAGDKVEGTVTRVAPFGAFVELAPGIEGLVHISEMSYLKRITKPEDMVSPGDKIPVMVKDVDGQTRRISLSMRDAEGDPWVGAQERFKPGKTLTGTLEKRESFGMFIRLEPGIVGLLPSSKMERTPGEAMSRLKPGDTLQVTVSAIDTDKRRISLAPAGAEGQEVDWASVDTITEQSMGTLGDKLKQALKKKDNTA